MLAQFAHRYKPWLSCPVRKNKHLFGPRPFLVHKGDQSRKQGQWWVAKIYVLHIIQLSKIIDTICMVL